MRQVAAGAGARLAEEQLFDIPPNAIFIDPSSSERVRV
jgi:hypothetical protein